MKPQGQIYVFTGPGKGKTSAALGVAMRSLGAKLSVAWIAWYKQESWGISEFNLPKIITTSEFHMHALGSGFHLDESTSTKTGNNIKVANIAAGAKVIDTASDKDHQESASNALNKAHAYLGKVDLLVLDEVNNAIHDNLISHLEVINLLDKRHNTHIILTGRDAHPDIIKIADLVTTMQKTKHPYDQGQLAIKGLDY